MDVRKNSLKAWILASRPKTLASAIAPVIVGLALAYHIDGKIKAVPACACLCFALLMQIAANLINDLYDYLKGSDGENRLGPKRATAQGWITPKAMKKGICVTIALACAIGSTLILYGGWQMVLVGLFCAIFAYLYTSGPYPLAYNGLGDVAVILFFGLTAVGFTCYVQTLSWPSIVTIDGLCTGVIINTLLIVNNYRDRDTDRESSKRTIIVRFGEKFGRYLYLISGLTGCIIAFSATAAESKNKIFATIAILYIIAHFVTWKKLCAIREGERLNTLIGETSRNMLLYSILLSITLIVS